MASAADTLGDISGPPTVSTGAWMRGDPYRQPAAPLTQHVEGTDAGIDQNAVAANAPSLGRHSHRRDGRDGGTNRGPP